MAKMKISLALYWLSIKFTFQTSSMLSLAFHLAQKQPTKMAICFIDLKQQITKTKFALLSQLRFFDNRRISDYYRGKILKADFENIKSKIKENIIK